MAGYTITTKRLNGRINFKSSIDIRILEDMRRELQEETTQLYVLGEAEHHDKIEYNMGQLDLLSLIINRAYADK